MTAGRALPRILLITDADLSPGSRGAGRTLVNLFSSYPPERLLAVSGIATAPYQMATGSQVLAGAAGLPGRVIDWLRPVVGDIGVWWSTLRPLQGARAVQAFAPELIVAVPTHPVGIALTERYAALCPGTPIVTYLMDDWIRHFTGSTFAFDTPRRGAALLQRSQAWLMISEYLLESVRADLGATVPAQVVHNPVRIGAPPVALDTPRRGTFRVAYAGSIWPMHADAVFAVAESVARLRRDGADIEMVVYTDRFFWGRNADAFAPLGVRDGGLLPYDALGAALGDCDLLLVASSFDPAQAHMSRSSVQTKVTDYMAAGRPILACGPPDAASNRFLRSHGCALFAEDPSPSAMDAVLRAAMHARGDGPALARRAWEIVVRDHAMSAVTERLYAFLADGGRGAATPTNFPG